MFIIELLRATFGAQTYAQHAACPPCRGKNN